MKIQVTEQGVIIPKEFFEGIEEVELRTKSAIQQTAIARITP